MESRENVILGSICDAKSGGDCKEIKLTFSEISYPQHSADVDYSSLANSWGVAFSSVVFLYLFSLSIAQVIRLVKNA